MPTTKKKFAEGKWRWVNDDGTLGDPCPAPTDQERAAMAGATPAPPPLQRPEALPPAEAQATVELAPPPKGPTVGINKKQELAMWVFGVVLAAASFVHGNDHSDFTLGVGVPIVIIGGLTVFSLRTRKPAQPAIPKGTIVAGIVILLGLGMAARAGARIDALESDLDMKIEIVESGVAEADSTVDDLKSKVEGLESKLEDLDLRLGYVER